MNSIVCIKRVPDITSATLKIDAENRKLDDGNLVFSINEADNYALEEALLLQEEFGGEITLISVGPKECDDIIRMGLAKGATRGIRITPDNLYKLDPYAIANLIAEQIKELEYDLIFTGCMANDDNFGQLGVTLAGLLNIPHISLAVKIQANEDYAIIDRELEGGLMEQFNIKFPAVITIQTGINEPRYASIFGIKRASKKEIRFVENISAQGIKVHTEKMYLPPPGDTAEIFTGNPEETAEKVYEILKTKGLI